MNKYIRLGKNTLLVFIGNTGSKLISFVMLPFYTRWLSVEDYGITDLINVYVTLLLGMVTACIADAVFVFSKGQPFDKQGAYFSSGLIFTFFSLLLTALLFKIVVSLFAFRTLSNSFTDNALFVYCLLVVTFLQQYIQQFVRSIDKMKIYSTTGIVLTICTALFSFIMIPCWGVFGYVFALIFANISAAFYSLFLSGAFKYFAFKYFKRKYCIEMLKFSIPLIPQAVIWWLIGALNRPLMEYYLGIYAIGIFGIANRFSGILYMAFSIFSVSWENSVMEEFGKDDYSYFYNKIFRLVVTGLVFLFLVITISSEFLVSILISPNFYEAWRYIPILTFGVVFLSISAFIGVNFSAAKQSKYFLYSNVWVIVLLLICNFFLIPKYGIMGAAITVPISISAMVISRILYALKYVRIKNIMHYVVMFILGIVMILTMLYIQNIIYKYLITVLIFISFIIVNYGLKDDILKIFSIVINSKWRSNK